MFGLRKTGPMAPDRLLPAKSMREVRRAQKEGRIFICLMWLSIEVFW